MAPTRIEYPNHAVHPVPSQRASLPDLRHAILQVQVHCQLPTSSHPTLLEPNEDVDALADWTNSWMPEINLSPEPAISSFQNDDARILAHLSKFMEDVSFSNCLEQRVEDVFEVRTNDVISLPWYQSLIALVSEN